MKNENFAITIEKSNYITLIIQFKILLDKLNNIFSAEVNSQMSTLNLYDCEILKNSRLSLNRFKNLRNLELSASKQEINFYQLFDLAWGQILARIELKNFKIEQRDIIRIFLFKNLVFLKFSNCNFAENIQKCFKRKKGCCLKRLILSFNPEVNYKELSNYLFEEFDNIFSLEIYHPVPPN
ncbi:hypothetical protein CWI39_0209p0020 [Hamiltosporidium magnivora]|uniref:Uncharacterized protein n=2 Tax=Hamiltosporidium TaxID=1176354 RepID=A0A4Q9LJ65_9MICR|nr:hypothetical protein CWI39_0209p0020 [Hamiltosporidium magnivora]